MPTCKVDDSGKSTLVPQTAIGCTPFFERLSPGNMFLGLSPGSGRRTGFEGITETVRFALDLDRSRRGRTLIFDNADLES